jgi:hypothetical protein
MEVTITAEEVLDEMAGEVLDFRLIPITFAETEKSNLIYFTINGSKYAIKKTELLKVANIFTL